MSDAWLEAVLRLLERYDIAEFEYEDETRHIIAGNGRISEATPARPAETLPLPAPIEIGSPHIGIFRSAHPVSPQPVELPRHVREGEIIGFLQIGMLLRPVLAPRDGILTERLIEDGTLADYGRPLFLLHPGRR
ncbi:acetyl-CoA carboxylase [Rhizobium cremeum]|uniref:acetyl-CoA carboxylase biotin carboxyl carrier protein n=1 Tax=Rhizobium cremeum TaxID=2813827 RepID=UPI000DDFAE7C|nr:acetyl-CoA carboxylase [Rhizobium cremeum]MCJ7995019.1 acetyl-CoA carboxylase [Rhizobium cremeum]MCJ8000669.1 acetyl-CoA carboxylase [Rhizobium cremeum]